jgi:hypothetical protein
MHVAVLSVVNSDALQNMTMSKSEDTAIDLTGFVTDGW